MTAMLVAVGLGLLAWPGPVPRPAHQRARRCRMRRRLWTRRGWTRRGWIPRERTRSARAARSRTELAEIPLVLDLLACVLDAGQPLEPTLRAVAPVAGARLASELGQVASLLRLGAAPAEAWSRLGTDRELHPVAATAIRSAESGIRLARGFRALAAELRADARGAATARAQRVGVWSMAPLGLCFLPAFVCVGIVPTVIGVARGVLDSGAVR